MKIMRTKLIVITSGVSSDEIGNFWLITNPNEKINNSTYFVSTVTMLNSSIYTTTRKVQIIRCKKYEICKNIILWKYQILQRGPYDVHVLQISYIASYNLNQRSPFRV